MDYGIVNVAIAAIYEGPFRVKERADWAELPELTPYASAISDEGLCGMAVAVNGLSQRGFIPIRTFYGYEGFIAREDLVLVDEKQLMAWESGNLMVIDGRITDVLLCPKVQGVCLLSLFRGSLVWVEAFDTEESGWARVRLPDGRCGYVRNQQLAPKRFSQAGLLDHSLVQLPIPSETSFRQAVADTAYSFMGTQYRWGGRSSAGIDCSGLASVSYMLNGIIIYRDAKIMEGYPVHEIGVDQLKKGDLLYFPGHIAVYLDGMQYVHSTGKAGSGGVVINSLAPTAPDYREDLAKFLYAVGSIF